MTALPPLSPRHLRHAPLRGVAAALALGLVLAAPIGGAAGASEAGDLVFAERGPWSLGDKVLSWAVTREGPARPDLPPMGAGTLSLAQTVDASDGKPVLQLTQSWAGGAAPERRIGPFPVSGGDPAVIYFLESTTRDMATLSGGSPDYIRNRLKDALFRGGRVSRADGRTTVELAPFADDPNRARMHGFDTLTLRFVLGDDPKAPIREMVAATAGPVAAELPREMAGQTAAPTAYRHALVLQ